MIDDIAKKSIQYYRFMLEEWIDFIDVNEDIVETIKTTMIEPIEGRDIFKYISKPRLYVFYYDEKELGYNVECDCVWEPEHQLDIIIRNNEVLYVGPSTGLSPYEDPEEYNYMD